MKLFLSCFTVWLISSLPFAYIVARIIRFGSRDVDFHLNHNTTEDS